MKKAKKTRTKAPSKATRSNEDIQDEVAAAPEEAASEEEAPLATSAIEPSPAPEAREVVEMSQPASDPTLSFKVTNALHNKLIRTAQEEGVTLEALVGELLAEGVVLRAWEIVERKSAMRGGQVGQQPGNFRPNNNVNHRHDRRGGNNNNNNNNRPGRRGGGAPNNAWMEDKAAFLEYVRNQEKRRR